MKESRYKRLTGVVGRLGQILQDQSRKHAK